MKTLVIDAIVGIGFAGQITLASECERAGLAEFTGNQHNPDWEWRRNQLEKIDLEKLQELYTALREAREEGSATEPEEEKSLIQLQ